MSDRRPSVGSLFAWHALVLALLFTVADLRVNGVGFWSSRPEEFIASLLLLGAYLLTALISIAAAAVARPLRWSTVVATSLSVFGLAFLALLVLPATPLLVQSNAPYSRALLLSMVAAGLVLAVASLVVSRARWIAIALLAVCVTAAAALDLYKTFGPRKVPPMTSGVKELATALYPVELETYENPVAKSPVYGGAIAVIGDRYLLATGDGRMFVFAWPAGGKLEKPQPLPNRVPFNPDEFDADSHTKWKESEINSDAADYVKGIQTWQFRVADVLVQSDGDRVRVFASHHYWNRKDRCFTVRVSELDAEREAFLAGKVDDQWKTIFEASPCLPVAGPESRVANNPFGGMEIGGRMAFMDDHTLLLTLGDHDFSGVDSASVLAQDPKALYGKTIVIHLEDDSTEIFTMGHRNPQGLFIDPDGTVWETEHGPQGGDELNILRKGENYGWPLVTYGTDYGMVAWPLNRHQGHHDGYVPPAYAWVPSIGVSNLLRVRGDAFPFWKDDLLVASLHGKTIFRVHLEEQRPVFAEPIEVGDRIRDIVEGPDGQIVMWTDSYNLVSLHPAAGSGGAVLFGIRCGGCHRVDKGMNNGYGPDLYGVVGHKAGSNRNFEGYSPAMKAYGKTWTRDELNRFLENPPATVPGTLMNVPGVQSADERAALIGYLDATDE
jgi:aldose sugar dehydrogenase